MFGRNPIRKQQLSLDGSLIVQEIFPTLQGEGPFAGRPAIFVRLAGCNLRCWFCDTDFESRADSPARAVEEVVEEVLSLSVAGCKTRLVVLTGGEPFRQDILPFLAECAKRGLWVQIETAGTLWIEGTRRALSDGGHEVVCSPKTPKINEELRRACHDYKYIISATEPLDPEDGLPFATTQGNALSDRSTRLARPPGGAQVWVQACDEPGKDPREALRRCAEVAMRYGYNLSIQQHKVIGIP